MLGINCIFLLIPYFNRIPPTMMIVVKKKVLNVQDIYTSSSSDEDNDDELLKEDSDKNPAKIKNQGNSAKHIEKSSSQEEFVGQCIKKGTRKLG